VPYFVGGEESHLLTFDLREWESFDWVGGE